MTRGGSPNGELTSPTPSSASHVHEAIRVPGGRATDRRVVDDLALSFAGSTVGRSAGRDSGVVFPARSGPVFAAIDPAPAQVRGSGGGWSTIASSTIDMGNTNGCGYREVQFVFNTSSEIRYRFSRAIGTKQVDYEWDHDFFVVWGGQSFRCLTC